MDLLNRAYSQLYNLFRSMTPGGRLTAGLLAAVVLLSFGYLFTHEVSTPDADLMNGVPVPASQLPAMEAAFGKANLNGYKIQGTSIRVPRGQEATYMAALVDAKALPQDFGTAMREAISASASYEDPRRREQRVKVATQDELALIIRSMKGIETAYVLYDIDKPGGFKDKVITATACVKPAGSEQLDDGRVSAIRHLVAGAIAGLKPQNVTVSDLNGRTWYGNPEDGGDAGNNLYISLKRVYEQDFKAKILNSLGFIPNVTVAVNVELDHERIIRTKQFKRALDAAGQQEPANSGRVRDIDSQSGRATTSAQRPNVATALDVLWGSPRGGNEAMEVDDGLVGSRVQVEKESVGPTPIWVRVSVWVPVAYFKKIWQEATASAEPNQASRTPDPAALKQFCADESAKIQRLVAQLLPPTDGETDAIKRVAVTTFQDIPAQEPLAPTFGQNALNWASQSWGALSMIGLALVSLLVLRSMVRSAPVEQSSQREFVSDGLPDDDVSNEHTEPSHGRQPRPFHAAGRSPREDLSALVEQDPETAVHILNNWIGHGG